MNSVKLLKYLIKEVESSKSAIVHSGLADESLNGKENSKRPVE